MNFKKDSFSKDQVCKCGKKHINPVEEILVGKGVLNQLPRVLERYEAKKAFILADLNTYAVAGDMVANLLNEAGVEYFKYIFKDEHLEPDEKAVGSAVMHFNNKCDVIIAIGSGVINDIAKILANISGKKYIIVATAPSMDGYASDSSSMAMDGVKVSLGSKCADVIIGDIDILKTAPDNMLRSGMGDMLAKYISICEWRIANLINGEYYCEEVAKMVRDVLKCCTDNAEALLKRDENAISAVFEGLVKGGIAMAYAGVSRPASGVEHYFSHIWDMRGLEFGEPVDFHGIQCAIGTYIAANLYEKIKSITPDKEKAVKFVNEFDFNKWADELREFIGQGAEAMIELEAKEKKYDVNSHLERIDVIINNWERILGIIDEEIPSVSELEVIFKTINLPKEPSEIGIPNSLIPMTFKATKDIRDKYVLSRLAWDLGILDEII